MAEAEGLRELLDQLVRAAGATDAAHPPVEIAARLLAALLAGSMLAFIYRRTYTGPVYLISIAHTQVLLAIGGGLIWLVVGENLVRAFGLAGMIGLIRYRTRITDPKDTTVLLFSMIIGMACGLGQYMVACIGTGVVACSLIGLKLRHHPADSRAPEHRLQEFLRAELDNPDNDD